VQNFLANSTSDDLLTFIVVRLTDSAGGTQNYVHAIAAKEALLGSGAFLNITTEPGLPVPEPATGWSFAITGCGLLPQLRRRRTVIHQTANAQVHLPFLAFQA